VQVHASEPRSGLLGVDDQWEACLTKRLCCPLHISSRHESTTACRSQNVLLFVQTSIVSVNLCESPSVPYILESLKLHAKTSLCRASVGSQREATCICCSAPAPAEWRLQHDHSSLSISPARRELSSEPAGSRWCCRPMGQMDGWTANHYTDPALHTMWAASISQRSRENWTPSLSLTLPDDNGTMDVCNRAHADRPRCKWCHGLCCLIPMSIRVRLQLTAVWKVTATSVCGLGRRCWSSPQLVSILNMTGM